MRLTEYKNKAITDRIILELSKRGVQLQRYVVDGVFSTEPITMYTDLEHHGKAGALKPLHIHFNATAQHAHFKNMTLMSHASEILDSSICTRIYVQIRFLHGARKSPIIGHNLFSFKITQL